MKNFLSQSLLSSKNLLLVPLVALGLVATTACSTQNREADPQVDDEELLRVFEEIRNGFANPALNSFGFEFLTESNAAVMYHARQSAGRPATSILSLDDMSLIHEFWEMNTPSTAIGLAKVDVIFLDTLMPENAGPNGTNSNGTRLFTLMMRLEGFANEVVYFSATSQPNAYFFSDDQFEVSLFAPNGETIILRSHDLSEKYDEELADSVKLDIYVLGADGREYYAGQISTMAGFGNR